MTPQLAPTASVFTADYTRAKPNRSDVMRLHAAMIQSLIDPPNTHIYAPSQESSLTLTLVNSRNYFVNKSAVTLMQRLRKSLRPGLRHVATKTWS